MNEPTENYGAHANLALYGTMYRTVITFDVRTVDRTASIEKATLRLYAEGNAAPTGQPIPVEAYALTEAWTEGTKTGSDKADGATWNKRTSSLAWTTPGGSYAPSVVGTTSAPAGFAPGWLEIDVTAVVREWVDRLSVNNGFLLLCRTSDLPYFTSRNSVNANRPELVVTYSGGAPSPAQPLASPTR
ncbi:MAG: DNRLRE domain-containing protein [Deltaproteobacteria bacterium]|nr:DNRLRE domain-containing protein [Deltaproteobacteria bacterium]